MPHSFYSLLYPTDALDTQTHRHTDTQTHRHTDTQTHRHADTQTHRHADTQTHRHTDTQTRKTYGPRAPHGLCTHSLALKENPRPLPPLSQCQQ